MAGHQIVQTREPSMEWKKLQLETFVRERNGTIVNVNCKKLQLETFVRADEVGPFISQ